MIQGYEIPTVQHRPPTFKVDKSATISFNTGELNTEQKMQVLNNDGLLGTLIFVPEDAQHTDIKKINSEFEGKKPSERLFNVIAVYWQQQGKPDSLASFYANEIEKLIITYKSKLEPNY